MDARMAGAGVKSGKTLLVVAMLVMLFALVMNALAADCPPAASACKIITLTPDEENTLSGPEMLFDHALWANRVKFDSMLQAWREKLKTAPAGIVKPATTEPGKKQDKLPSGSPASPGEAKK